MLKRYYRGLTAILWVLEKGQTYHKALLSKDKIQIMLVWHQELLIMVYLHLSLFHLDSLFSNHKCRILKCWGTLLSRTNQELWEILLSHNRNSLLQGQLINKETLWLKWMWIWRGRSVQYLVNKNNRLNQWDLHCHLFKNQFNSMRLHHLLNL